eukprot:GHVT01032433.1.p1 GENE.GHVT01032433.1~~GHVT01032433.1.p1  ORF type:complete len:281 (+),score=57.82 GHVT01032433.1:823-1665(+)
MVLRNPSMARLQRGYLFVEIARRKKEFLAKNPNAKLISLGIGDTTEPITAHIAAQMREKCHALTTLQGYSGYPEYNGSQMLRTMIAREFYNDAIAADEIFISDGSKPDLARLQSVFGPESTVAVQNPVYPAFVDGTVISGKSGELDESTGHYRRIVYMTCTPENDFFPDLEKQPRTDLIFFCSPNNPTGAVASREQLTSLVKYAKANKSIIIFDSAYRAFIKDPALPKSIFEIEGAEEVAFETCSFSKMAGFTGVRLGWTVCPKAVKFDDGTPLWNDWSR